MTKRLLVALAVLGLVTMSRVAVAQTDLSGSWAARNHEDALERAGGPYAVDYTGLPLNDEGRIKALSYSSSQLSMIERQCGGWPPFYLAQGPFGLKMWNETDSVNGTTTAWVIGAWEDRAATTTGRTVVLIRRRTRRTSEAASRRVSGTATRSSRRRRT